METHGTNITNQNCKTFFTEEFSVGMIEHLLSSRMSMKQVYKLSTAMISITYLRMLNQSFTPSSQP